MGKTTRYLDAAKRGARKVLGHARNVRRYAKKHKRVK